MLKDPTNLNYVIEQIYLEVIKTLEEPTKDLGIYKILLIILSGISGLCIDYLLFCRILGIYIPIKYLIPGTKSFWEELGAQLIDLGGMILRVVFTGILSAILGVIIAFQFKKKNDLVRLTSIGSITTIFLIVMVFLASANVFIKESEWTLSPQPKYVEEQTGTIGSKLRVTNITNNDTTFYITMKNATGYDLVTDINNNGVLDIDKDNHQADIMITIKNSTGTVINIGDSSQLVDIIGNVVFTSNSIDNGEEGQIKVTINESDINPGETYTIIIKAVDVTSTEKYTAI